MANFVYTTKGEPRGNARPVPNASRLLGDEPFFVFLQTISLDQEVPRAVQLLKPIKNRKIRDFSD